MDFSNHPINNNRQSIVDKRNFSKSTVDYQTERLREKLNDPNLGSRMVALVLAKLGEAEINNIADYALRKADHPGKVFVTICNNVIKEK